MSYKIDTRRLSDSQAFGQACESLVLGILEKRGYVRSAGTLPDGRTYASGSVFRENDLRMELPGTDVKLNVSVKGKRTWLKGGKSISLAEIAEMLNHGIRETGITALVIVTEEGDADVLLIGIADDILLHGGG